MKISVRRIRLSAEPAERASDDADIRKVQVPVDNVRDQIADGSPPQLIRYFDQSQEIISFDTGEDQAVFSLDLISRQGSIENPRNRRTGRSRCLLPGDRTPLRSRSFQH